MRYSLRDQVAWNSELEIQVVAEPDRADTCTSAASAPATTWSARWSRTGTCTEPLFSCQYTFWANSSLSTYIEIVNSIVNLPVIAGKNWRVALNALYKVRQFHCRTCRYFTSEYIGRSCRVLSLLFGVIPSSVSYLGLISRI